MAPPTWTSSTTITTRSRGNMLKNVLLLAGMWGMGLGAAFCSLPATQSLLVDAGFEQISTAPLGIIMIGSSPCAVALPTIISRYGEKKTFIVGSIFGIIGALIQMMGPLSSKIGITASDDNDVTTQVIFVMAGTLPQAFLYASTNNLRFSVLQFSTPDFLPKATAFVLLGGVLAALVGPLLSIVTRPLFPGALYAGNFLQIALMYLVFATLAFFADFKPPLAESNGVRIDSYDLSLVERQEVTGLRIDRNATTRTLLEITKSTDLVLLTTFQCLSYNIMAMYMGQFKLPMASLGYSVDAYTYALTAHMLGMFLPGLFSGHVIHQFGVWTTTTVGFLLFPIGGAMFLINDSISMFVVGITIVGIGWNLSFVGPSSEVSKIHSPAEQAKVVGFNGIMLFTAGIVFMTASKIYIAIDSWDIFNYALIGVSVCSALLSLLRGICKRRVSDDDTFSADSLAQSLLTAGSVCTL